MLRTTSLSRLPRGVTFPTKLQDRIRYDASKKQLSFDGFMSKTDFDQLAALDNDAEFQRAMERLLQICTFESATPSIPPSNRRYIVWCGAAALTIAIGCGLAWHHWLGSRPHDLPQPVDRTGLSPPDQITAHVPK